MFGILNEDAAREECDSKARDLKYVIKHKGFHCSSKDEKGFPKDAVFCNVNMFFFFFFFWGGGGMKDKYPPDKPDGYQIFNFTLHAA